MEGGQPIRHLNPGCRIQCRHDKERRDWTWGPLTSSSQESKLQSLFQLREQV